MEQGKVRVDAAVSSVSIKIVKLRDLDIDPDEIPWEQDPREPGLEEPKGDFR